MVGLVVAADAGGPTLTQVIGAALVALWSAAGIALGVRLRRDRLGPIVLAGAVATGVVCLAQSLVERAEVDASGNDTAEIVLRVALGLLPAFTLHLLVALPDGRLTTSRRRWGVAAGYSVGLIVGGVLCVDLDTMTLWPVVALWGAAFAAGIPAAYGRYRTAGAVDRRRIQWLGWGITVAAEGILVTTALRLLADWPHDPGAVALAMTGLVPIAIIAGTLPKMVARVDRLLTHTVALAGLTALILLIYVIVVLGFGRTPRGSERSLLLLSMVAAAIAAAAVPPGQELADRARRTGWCTAHESHPTRCCGPSASGSPDRFRSTSCCCSWPRTCAARWCSSRPRSGRVRTDATNVLPACLTVNPLRWRSARRSCRWWPVQV